MRQITSISKLQSPIAPFPPPPFPTDISPTRGDRWSNSAGPDDGRTAGGAVQLPAGAAVHHHPPQGPPPSPRRPIAKFNAKVMRDRVRLRAAMQERPAKRAGQPFRENDGIPRHVRSDDAFSTSCLNYATSRHITRLQIPPAVRLRSRDHLLPCNVRTDFYCHFRNQITPVSKLEVT
ncbi:unnamed protein product [Chilo suppressalis]|uniref:Uncharacterized protein n=1 Tax=Chilo suppressalis TaxID=168631 RepID=A0ABN8B4H0_CHISP|nr:unnamed protein product [Chilo suppressalis]